jgi:hypothetical protein
LIFRRDIGGRGFGFWFNGDFVGHIDFLWYFVNIPSKTMRLIDENLRDGKILTVGVADAIKNPISFQMSFPSGEI